MRYKAFFQDTLFNLIVEVSEQWFEYPDKLIHLETFASMSSIMLERLYDSPVIQYKLVLDINNPDSTRLFSFTVRKLPQDPKIWHVFYVIDDYYLCPDQKYYFTDESGSYIPIVREAFTELLSIFVPVNGYLTFDTSPRNTEKDTSTKYLLYYLSYHEFRHNDSEPYQYSMAQAFSLPERDNKLHLPLPEQEISQNSKKKRKQNDLSQNLHTPGLDTFLSAKDSSIGDTVLKPIIPQTTTQKPLEPPGAQTDKQSPGVNTNTDLRFLAQVKRALALDHHAPLLSSHPKQYIHTLMAKLSYEQLPDAQKDTYLTVFPHHIQKKITDIKTGPHAEAEKTTVLNKVIADYQEQVSQRLEKQRSKTTTYLTTPSSPNLSVGQDKKGLVYSLAIPNHVPDSFISKSGKLTIPNGYHALTPAEKFNELTTLQLRINNFREIIHHDLLVLANNPFLGKTYSPNNTTTSSTAEEILQLCLNTATHPDEWQLTGRKILALHLENPGTKIPTIQVFLRNATAGPGSQVDYRFPDDFIRKLYCTTVSKNHLRYMLTDHVGSSLSSLLGKRVTGSLMLLWLYAPLLTDHTSESSRKERAGFLTHLYPPDSLKDVLKDIRNFDVPEVAFLPSDAEHSLKYRFPLQKFKRKLASSSFEITSIWQSVRVLVCGLAYLTNPTTIQTKISNKAPDLYSEIYYSVFKVLQERIVMESSKDTNIPCSLASLLMFSSDDPIMPKIWSQWLQFFMVLVAQKKSFIKPSTLKDMLKNLYLNYPHKKHRTALRPAQPFPRPQSLPPTPATTDPTLANDDDTLEAIALGLTDVEEFSSTIASDSSPSSMYEWRPVLRGIINYEKKHTILNFGTNEAYSDPHAFMSLFFVTPVNDVWQTYTYNYHKSNQYGTTLSTGNDLLYFDLIEKGLSTISDQSQLESLKQAFRHGQPLTFPPLPNTEHRFNFSPLTLSPNDVLGVVLKLPTTPTPHNNSDWQFTYFQLQGVNPLYVLLSERQSDNTLHHREFQFPILRWSRPSRDNLPTFHFGQDYAHYSHITLDEQGPVPATPPASKPTKKLPLKPTEIIVPFKYHISIDQGVRNPISFKIRKLPKTLDTQTLDFTTLDGTLRKASVRETLGSGFIGHATPKGSFASEPVLLTAKDGIITNISSTQVDVLSRGTIEDRPSTPQTADTLAAAVVSFAIAASNKTLDHGFINYSTTQSLPQSQVLPQLSGYALKNVLDSTGKKQDNSKDNPKSKPEAWLYHLIRIQARLDDRYIDICSKKQIVSMLEDLYTFVNPSHQRISWLTSSFIRSKVKDYRTKHQDNTFLQQFSVTTLVKWLKSNAIIHLKSALDHLWLRERLARREFTRLLMKLFEHEVFESGILPPNTQVNDVLLGLEDLRGYHPKKFNKKKRDTPDPFWTALEKDFQTSTGNPKKDFFRSLWLDKAQDLDNSKATSRKNSLWSHGLLKSYFQGVFTKNNIVPINPAGTSLQCMSCGQEGERKGEVFTCKNKQCEKYHTPVNADSNANPNIEVRSIHKFFENLVSHTSHSSSDLATP